MKHLALLLALVVLGCSPTDFEVVVFWQEVRDAPGVAADPYSGTCDLIDEEWTLVLADPSDISSGVFWIKRRYLCPR